MVNMIKRIKTERLVDEVVQCVDELKIFGITVYKSVYTTSHFDTVCNFSPHSNHYKDTNIGFQTQE